MSNSLGLNSYYGINDPSANRKCPCSADNPAVKMDYQQRTKNKQNRLLAALIKFCEVLYNLVSFIARSGDLP